MRVIGKGGFASVWMAKRKGEKSGTEDSHVAVKVMKEDGYAKRELAILSELSSKSAHPNIVRIVQGLTATGVSGSYCVVFSLARGPTLHYIVNKSGALGLVVAQSISSQLIDAVAYLHGHAGEFLTQVAPLVHSVIYPRFTKISHVSIGSSSQGHSTE